MKTQPKKKLKTGNNQHTSDVTGPWKQNKETTGNNRHTSDVIRQWKPKNNLKP